MKRILFFVVLILLIENISGQVSISSEKYNAVNEIKPLPEGMTYAEFQKIQRYVDWKKITVAAILPGYIHFYSAKPEIGWAIFGTRLIGSLMMGFAMYDQYKISNALDFAIDINSEADQSRTRNNAIVFSTGLVLNMLGFAFDWAHGDWVVESERNQVYFKYGIDEEKRKLLGISYNSELNTPEISFSLKL